MTPELSLYLDLVRILAAGLVLVEHTNLRVLSREIPAGAGFGHSAVVVFFVLSGFVISYVSSTREQQPRAYAVSRVSRIYSVLIPALLLAMVLDTAGRQIDPGTYYAQSPHDWWWVRVLATLTVMNEPWGISITAFSAPFWSVAYEGWYYILFGLFMFWHGRARTLVLVAAALLAGPKVLLLAPIWLAGVYLHRGRHWTRLTAGPACGLFVVSLLAIVVYHWSGGPAYFRGVVEALVGRTFQVERMTWSGEFIGDYLVGLMVMLNFAAFRAAGPRLAWLVVPLARPIRWAASFTFSLYLYHRAFILFYVACLKGDPRSSLFYFEVVGLALVSVYLLGLVTEHRKRFFRGVTERCFQVVERVVARSALHGPARPIETPVG
jgi:peptidoglycan/LPS O-acetylase OafA/YrhL